MDTENTVGVAKEEREVEDRRIRKKWGLGVLLQASLVYVHSWCGKILERYPKTSSRKPPLLF